MLTWAENLAQNRMTYKWAIKLPEVKFWNQDIKEQVHSLWSSNT